MLMMMKHVERRVGVAGRRKNDGDDSDSDDESDCDGDMA